MNYADRNALIELGRQFAPNLFRDLDPSTVKDEAMLEHVGNAFALLSAAAAPDAEDLPDPQPTPEAVAAWLANQHLTVQQQTVLLTTVDGRKRQSYAAREEPATIDDVLSYRLDALSGDLHLVMNDGRTHRLPFLT